jgi:hypothetical protein
MKRFVMILAPWLILVPALLWGCGAGDEAATETAQASLDWQAAERGFRSADFNRFQMHALPRDAEEMAREIARDKLDRAADQCAQCADRACELQCLFEEDVEFDLGEGEVIANCIVCGRETGFLPRPTLHLALVGEKTIELSWEAVDGATHYSVYGLQWSGTEPTGAAVASFIWQTQNTRIVQTLEEGSSYRFHLVAWSDGEVKQRSQPSLPVSVDL